MAIPPLDPSTDFKWPPTSEIITGFAHPSCAIALGGASVLCIMSPDPADEWAGYCWLRWGLMAVLYLTAKANSAHRGRAWVHLGVQPAREFPWLIPRLRALHVRMYPVLLCMELVGWCHATLSLAAAWMCAAVVVLNFVTGRFVATFAKWYLGAHLKKLADTSATKLEQNDGIPPRDRDED
eukprot:TRINITY_DN30625_c0_g1_i1.p1 TRINITY_DN30625_c0_g1~~TRINITY_DN30625_c0_g1_i1.p1  ORF type:complete len:181 (+),score=31.10 TRINITY_DN30625_c0_g1_i1:175-717(+)